jgi:hypothetical protein
VNVVVVNDNAQVNGGAAKIAILDALGMAERGHRVFFLAAVLPIAPELHHPNITVVCTGQPDLLANPSRVQAFAQGLWNAPASRMAKELLAGLDPLHTVVHLHLWTRALSPSVVRAVLDANLPAICTLHDFLLACPTGTLFLHPQQTICPLRPMSLACIATNCDPRSYAQKLWRVGRQVIQERVAHVPGHLTDFLVQSQLAHEVMAPYLPPQATVHTLAPYIESHRSLPATPADNQNFVYLGRLVREKGVAMLARSAAAEQLPLVFIGSGPLEGDITPPASLIYARPGLLSFPPCGTKPSASSCWKRPPTGFPASCPTPVPPARWCAMARPACTSAAATSRTCDASCASSRTRSSPLLWGAPPTTASGPATSPPGMLISLLWKLSTNPCSSAGIPASISAFCVGNCKSYESIADFPELLMKIFA